MHSDDRPRFIDATWFLGMHDADPERQRRSTQFFIRYLNDSVYMNLEQVGLCDDVIWQRAREEQDAYYPFMDNLHSVMHIQRIGYQEEDLLLALHDQRCSGLNMLQATTIAQVVRHDGILATHDPVLLGRSELQPWLNPALEQVEDTFPFMLSELYQQSTTLMLTLQGSHYV